MYLVAAVRAAMLPFACYATPLRLSPDAEPRRVGGDRRGDLGCSGPVVLVETVVAI